MNDLIAWLRQQLDDDEETAKNATRGPWTVHRQGLEAIVSPGVAMDRDEGGVSVQDATHIARHDPTAVLADVAAKRELLAALEEIATDEYDPRAWNHIAVLARAYRHRPGWRTEWE